MVVVVGLLEGPGVKDLFGKQNPKVKMKKEVSSTMFVLGFHA
jgi:hypothetical protein